MKYDSEMVRIRMSNLDQTGWDLMQVAKNNWKFFNKIREKIMKKYGTRYSLNESMFDEKIGKMANQGEKIVVEGILGYCPTVLEGYHLHILSYGEIPVASSIGIEDKSGRINFMRFSNINGLESFLKFSNMSNLSSK